MQKLCLLALFLSCCQISFASNYSHSLDPNFSTGHISNKNVAEIPEIKKLFSSLKVLLEKNLKIYGKMPISCQEQRQFAFLALPGLQSWIDFHMTALLKSKKFLPHPDPSYLRYGRNLVLAVPKKGLYVFLHILNPHKATPKHWHSQKGLSSLAFATMLNAGGFETKWHEESKICDPTTGEEFIELKKEYDTPLPVGRLIAIPGDYGAHIVSNRTNDQILIFEIYFEPEKMTEIDIPITVFASNTYHFADTLPCKWLNELNLMTTATLEGWPLIQNHEAWKAILDTPESRVFTIVNGETSYIPKALYSRLKKDTLYILKGPENRFLIIRKR